MSPLSSQHFHLQSVFLAAHLDLLLRFAWKVKKQNVLPNGGFMVIYRRNKVNNHLQQIQTQGSIETKYISFAYTKKMRKVQEEFPDSWEALKTQLLRLQLLKTSTTPQKWWLGEDPFLVFGLIPSALANSSTSRGKLHRTIAG